MAFDDLDAVCDDWGVYYCNYHMYHDGEDDTLSHGEANHSSGSTTQYPSYAVVSDIARSTRVQSHVVFGE
jgi:hypothetical protein